MVDFPLKNLYIDHQSLLQLTGLFAKEEGTCLLYSGGSYETAQRSFLCLFPYDCIWLKGDCQQRYNAKKEVTGKTLLENHWEALSALGFTFDERKKASFFPEWVGFFGYEMYPFAKCEAAISYFPATTPEAYWQRCAIILKVDHLEKSLEVRVVEGKEHLFDEKKRQWIAKLSCDKEWIKLLTDLKKREKYPETNSFFDVNLESSDSEVSYKEKVRQIQELIKDGEVYQLNLSQQFIAKKALDPFALFLTLTSLNPTPFSAYLYLSEFSVICSSPERFLMKRQRKLETRPIKGTAPRGYSQEEDQRNKEFLLSSVKEKAELLMITDLMRNDLGKVSLPGSVQTPLIWGCETLANVFHLYSIVTSNIQEGIPPLKIAQACFPAGSITGCPKLRAMEMINDIEKRPRGIYTGSIGYFTENGDFDLNVAIRTFIYEKNSLNIQLGGGIVADSDPSSEYQETLHKGRSIFQTLNAHSFRL